MNYALKRVAILIEYASRSADVMPLLNWWTKSLIWTENGSHVSTIFIHCYSNHINTVRFTVDQINKDINVLQKEIGMKMKNKESADDLVAKKTELSKKRDELKKEVDEKEAERDAKLILIGNIVHESVPTSIDEVSLLLFI